jgi:hypothetical protein
MRSACVKVYVRLYTRYGFIPFYYSGYKPCANGKPVIISGSVVPIQQNGETKLFVNKGGILFIEKYNFKPSKDNLTEEELEEEKKCGDNYYRCLEQAYMSLRKCTRTQLGRNQIAMELNGETVYLNDGDSVMFGIDKDEIPFIIHSKNDGSV